MDRSLKWRTIILAGIVVYCVGTLAPTFAPKGSLPSWVTSIFNKKISFGLDLQGGLYLDYSIDLNAAVDDKATELKRDLESMISDQKLAGVVVKTPFGANAATGAVTVLYPKTLKDVDKVVADVDEVGKGIITTRDCTAADGTSDTITGICFRVSSDFADGVKKAALENAISTIRERIDTTGVADPTVVQKGDDIIVELPGLNEAMINDTKEIIARTAKLEFKVVDDGPTHQGAQIMKELFYKIMGNDDAHHGALVAPDPAAKKLGITAEPETWQPDDSNESHVDYTIKAFDVDESHTTAWAKKHDCKYKDEDVENGVVHCTVPGWVLIDRYVKGDKQLDYVGLAEQDPKFKIPDDHELGYELVEPPSGAKDKRSYWHSYYLEKAVRLTGSSISNAAPVFDQAQNRTVVSLEFNRYGGRVFGNLTAQISGQKLATVLDGKVRSAPVINGAIRGGRCTITMGGNDGDRIQKEANDLVNVLKAGSLPAQLDLESESHVGPTLGRDSIDKTRLSFEIGIGLVILIMVVVYRWSGGIAVFAVVFHIIMTLAVMAIFGATLTLPGIAAIVLSIGMEVDGNILIYERIRDELLLGKSVRGAIDLGFSRAFTAILDGQLTTAAAGWVLYQYGSGPIKGFAVMLLVGVFTTLTTNVWVTRILFDWAVARKKGTLATLSI